MKGNNLFHKLGGLGVAIPPQVGAGGTPVNGTAIAEPWRYGRQLAFIAAAGAIAGTISGATLTVQGRLRSDGSTWQAIKEHDGTTDLAFTPANLADGGAIENDALIGTLDLDRIDGETYDQIRLVFSPAGSGDYPIGVSYLIYEGRRQPADVVDELHSKAHKS